MHKYSSRWLVIVSCLAIVIQGTGCNLLLHQLGFWSGGHLIPAEYEGLATKRVAVVCVSDNSSYGVGTESELLARNVAGLLKERVNEIDVVRHEEVADWIDKNDWNEVDYREVGKGVKAEKVVAIDLAGFGLYEGDSLYRGRASVTVTIYDMEDGGKEVFRRQLPEIKFPANGVYHSSETSESSFRRTFIGIIAQQVGRYFYEYEPLERYARDPTELG